MPKASLSTASTAVQTRACTTAGLALREGNAHRTAGARVYSRIRTNKLDPSDTDITRGVRQQAVADAVETKIARVGPFAAPLWGGARRTTRDGYVAWELAQVGGSASLPAAPLPVGGERDAERRRASRIGGQRGRDLEWLGAGAAPPRRRALRRRLQPAIATAESAAGSLRLRREFSAACRRLLGRVAESPSFPASLSDPCRQ